jgi:putative two-component system response regulator
MQVLVVDDDSISRRAVAQTLSLADYDTVTATNGCEALSVLQRSGIQLVVSDWNMPGMNGLELCRAIRSADLRRYVYFVMLTSHSRPEDTLEGLNAGVDDYVTKPFQPGELVMRVNTGRRIVATESRDVTIFVLAKLAESRDPETGAHLERVRSYCRVLAQHLQHSARFSGEIGDDYVRLIFETSPLHDIGKVAIPDTVLLKPGRLTAQEFEIMKTHTLHGAQTLAAAMHEFPNAAFLRMAYDIALSHHERFDGSGYPRGLVGEAIPLCGRIVALADVYDALTSKRVYKDDMSHATAKAIIVSETGKHFDPAVVDVFLELDDEFMAIRDRYAEDAEPDTTPVSRAEIIPTSNDRIGSALNLRTAELLPTSP